MRQKQLAKEFIDFLRVIDRFYVPLASQSDREREHYDPFRKDITTAAREARYRIDRTALITEEYAKEERNQQRRERWARALEAKRVAPQEPQLEVVDEALLQRHREGR